MGVSTLRHFSLFSFFEGTKHIFQGACQFQSNKISLSEVFEKSSIFRNLTNNLHDYYNECSFSY